MDGVSAAASITALVTLGLQSAGIIYQIVDGIKEGPNQVRQLADQVDRLRRTLNQIACILAKEDQASQAESHGDLTELRAAMQNCTADLRKIQTKLEKLENSQNNRGRRVWSVVRVVFGSKEIEEAERSIRWHLQVLDSQLNIHGRHIDIGNYRQLSKLDGDIQWVSSMAEMKFDQSRTQTTIMEDHLSSQLTFLSTQYQATSSAAQRQSITQSKALDDLRFDNKSFQQNSRDWSDRMDKTSRLLEGVGQTTVAKIEKLSSGSSEQLQQITSTLRQIQLQLANHSQVESRILSIADIQNSVFKESRGAPNNSLGGDSSNSINRLCRLASSKPHTIASHQAQSIIDDLEVVLSNAERTATYSHIVQEQSQEYNQSQNPSVNNRLRGPSAQTLKRIRRLLSASQSISLKEKGFYQGLKVFERSLKSNATSWSCETQDGTIVVSATIKRPHQGKGASIKLKNDVDVQLYEDDKELFIGTVELLTRTEAGNVKISVFFLQRITCTSSIIATPILQFHGIIPDTSKVFKAIKIGDLAMLINLLDKREVALSDCDTRGCSLLNHALDSLQPSICKFLIEHGANPGSLERPLWSEDSLSFYDPLRQMIVGYCTASQSKYLNGLECEKLLLQAGADPTIELGANTEATEYCRITSFISALIWGTRETLLPYLDLAGHFINLESPRHGYGTILLETISSLDEVCEDERRGHLVAKVDLLLDYGANLDATDDEGYGCLHVSLYSLPENWSQGTEAVHLLNEMINMLLNRGADAHLIDSYGQTVTETALELGHGKMWFAALEDCKHKYDLSEFLAEDHARFHVWEDGRADEDHQDLSKEALKSHFSRCDKSDCNWWVWEHLDILSVENDIIREWQFKCSDADEDSGDDDTEEADGNVSEQKDYKNSEKEEKEEEQREQRDEAIQLSAPLHDPENIDLEDTDPLKILPKRPNIVIPETPTQSSPTPSPLSNAPSKDSPTFLQRSSPSSPFPSHPSPPPISLDKDLCFNPWS